MKYLPLLSEWKQLDWLYPLPHKIIGQFIKWMLNLYFFNNFLGKKVYIKLPLCYITKGAWKKVLKLKKALYGLKQAPRAWNTRIDAYFKQNDYKQYPYESVPCKKMNKNRDILLVCLYVDDLVFTRNNSLMFGEFKQTMVQEFEMNDIRLVSYFLDIEVKQSKENILISQ